MKTKMNWFAWIILAMTLAFFAPLNAAWAGFTLQVLYEFSGADGSAPRAGLVQGNDCKFYGRTELGGDDLGNKSARSSACSISAKSQSF